MIYLNFRKYYKLTAIILIIASLAIISGFISFDNSSNANTEEYTLDLELMNEMLLKTSTFGASSKQIPVYYKGREYLIDTDTDLKNALQKHGIVLKSNDLIFPSENLDLKNADYLFITNYEQVLETKEKTIEFKTVETEDPTLPIGERIVNREGSAGVAKETILKVYRNEEMTLEKVISEEVITPAVDGEILVGTMEVQEEIVEEHTTENPNNDNQTSNSDMGFSYSYYIDVQATAYDASVADGIPYTASGTIARPGVIAVDPSVIPLGTHVYIESLDGWPSYGYAVAEDTGSAIVGNIIDLFMDSHQTAIDFGRRSVRVYILN